MSRAKPDPQKSLPKSNEFALADRETEGESEGCEAQLLRMLVRMFVLDKNPKLFV